MKQEKHDYSCLSGYQEYDLMNLLTFLIGLEIKPVGLKNISVLKSNIKWMDEWIKKPKEFLSWSLYKNVLPWETLLLKFLLKCVFNGWLSEKLLAFFFFFLRKLITLIYYYFSIHMNFKQKKPVLISENKIYVTTSIDLFDCVQEIEQKLKLLICPST